jgi:superfamily II DNA or RNA helicase
MAGFDPDEHIATQNRPSDDIFREARLNRAGLTITQWPAQIDRAALDILYGIAIGKTRSTTDIGGTIDRHEFPEATGQFYVDGLRELAGDDSNLARALERYDPSDVGDLVFHLNEFRNQLREIGGTEMDVDRAVEALIEKAATQALDQSAQTNSNDGAGLRQLRGSDSTSDLVLKLFSDPRIEAYADALTEIVTETWSKNGLLGRLDEPRMTTPLWQHQREALQNWINNRQLGYVDMATATGKTVLGLGAIAARYGALHPVDNDLLQRGPAGGDEPRILIVAGNQFLLSQWRNELDEHLDIPPARTVPTETGRSMNIELGWGTIEFRTAQSLLQSSFFDYDLVILDEAHRYSASRSSGQGWGDIFEALVNNSDALLAMSGSVDGGWQGDPTVKDALESGLECVYRFPIPQARARGVIADFSWEVHYSPTTEQDEEKLAEQTQVITRSYSSRTGKLDADTLDIDASEIHNSFPTYATLRSFAQSNTGNDLRGRSEPFDLFATALFTRRPVQWNLSPIDETIIDLVTKHAPDQKTVVLVQNYNDASRLRARLVDDESFDESGTIALESSSDDRMQKIERFNGTEGGVIIGPGDLLGVGVDMPDAEVAVNVARGGVNASLIQRIGRILRNPKGNKEAQFYHVVPQATSDEAIDRYEDGRQLLQQAAEFHALGQSFKQVPSFSVADESVSATVATLERAGEEILERRGDEHVSELLEASVAIEALRDLRGAIQAVTDGSDAEADSPVPVIIDYWSTEDETTDQAGSSAESDDSEETTSTEEARLFSERNEVYEQYRLRLDQYRAAKGVAEHLLDSWFDIERNGDGYAVRLSPEYEKTEFHDHFERFFNEYHDLKQAADDSNNDGEPGSLPKYREHWSAPPKEDGVMVAEKVAERIGTDYTQDDPLFFPRENGELYKLPLPDGRVLAVDGICKRENASDDLETNSNEQMNTVDLSETIVLATRAQLETDQDGVVRNEIETWTRELVAAILNGTVPNFADEVELNNETVSIELSEDIMPFVRASCEGSVGPDDPNILVETAVRDALELEPGMMESISVEIPAELIRAAEASDQIDLSEAVEEAVEGMTSDS